MSDFLTIPRESIKCLCPGCGLLRDGIQVRRAAKVLGISKDVLVAQVLRHKREWDDLEAKRALYKSNKLICPTCSNKPYVVYPKKPALFIAGQPQKPGIIKECPTCRLTWTP